jgi:hypothetical protein
LKDLIAIASMDPRNEKDEKKLKEEEEVNEEDDEDEDDCVEEDLPKERVDLLKEHTDHVDDEVKKDQEHQRANSSIGVTPPLTLRRNRRVPFSGRLEQNLSTRSIV